VLSCDHTVATLLINIDWRTNVINMKFVYGNDFLCKAKELMSLLSITGAPNVIVLDAHSDFNDNIHYEEF